VKRRKRRSKTVGEKVFSGSVTEKGKRMGKWGFGLGELGRGVGVVTVRGFVREGGGGPGWAKQAIGGRDSTWSLFRGGTTLSRGCGRRMSKPWCPAENGQN